jgi:hypothetical protein
LTCYFRHLEQIFRKAGITVTSKNRRDLDKIVHSIIDVDYKLFSYLEKSKKRLLMKMVL